MPPIETAKEAPATQPPHYVAGIGASAGGLEALRALLSSMKRAQHMALVIVQHLAPQYRSRLVELLAHGAALRVKEIQSGERLEPGTAYVTPPNSDVLVQHGALFLVEPGDRIGPKPSIDRFFRSMADELEDSAVGVVLSGTGSDGALGVRAIKAAGGVTICQSMATAKYDGMPRAARQSGAIDLELSPEEIARQLGLLDEVAAQRAPGENLERTLAAGLDPYHAILAILERATKVDFSRYKQSTIRRRIDRRIAATRSGGMREYAEVLRDKTDERRLLFQDILISVTSFFRDPEAFESLARRLRERLASKVVDQPLRIWVVGCASGEEVYTHAILVAEALEAMPHRVPAQIFGTDIDERAMAHARKGIYPRTAVAALPDPLREKWFEEHGPDEVKVREALREMVIFARHDVAQDPPFLRLDIISCRNVLIYFTARLQEQVLRTFHYALEGQGVLMLGRSEAVTAVPDMFFVDDKSAKIFRRSGKPSQLPRTYTLKEPTHESQLGDRDRESTDSAELLESMVSAFAPDSVLVDRDLNIRHIYGKANRYLNVPQGEPSTSLNRLVQDDVAAELQALVRRAERVGHVVRGLQRHVVTVDRIGEVALQLSVVPVSRPSGAEFFIAFGPAPHVRRDPPEPVQHLALPAEEQVRRLEQELLTSREHLQTLTEEHETASEELQALNEELQSSNEELQSTNEELETTNEELQSANEELTTLNQEINVRSGELVILNQRFQAIQNAIVYPLVIVDSTLRIVDYNPAARYLLRISELDRGATIGLLASPVDASEVAKLVDEALRSGRDARTLLRAQERSFEIRVQLIRSPQETIEGAVVSFVENTELVRALEETGLHRGRLSSILDNTPALVTMKDTTGVYTYANRRFLDETGREEAAVIGRTDEELFGEMVGGQLRDQDFEVLRTRSPLRSEEMVNYRDGRIRWWLSSRFPLLDDRRNAVSVCMVSLEITESVNARSRLEAFQRVIASSSAGVAMLEADGGDDFQVTFASGEFAGTLRSTAGQLCGMQLEALLGAMGWKEDRGATIPELAGRLRSGAVASASFEISPVDGREQWIELRCARLDCADRRYLALMLFDVSERVLTQRMLQSQQDEVARMSKLASLGEVAAGISHEINTPLNVITARAGLLRKLAERGELHSERLLRAAGEIESMVESIARVILGLKSLTRLDSEHMHEADLRQLVGEAVRICDFRLQRGEVRVVLDLPEQPVHVTCYSMQLVQVLINLVNNSVDAISDLKDRWVRLSLRALGGSAEIRVTDSGRGIDTAIAERIMTPFFTTKKDASGTGLGLSISRNIARHHGGELRVDTAAKNTTFVVELPMAITAGSEEHHDNAHRSCGGQS